MLQFFKMLKKGLEPGGSVVMNPLANAGDTIDTGLIPCLGVSPMLQSN